MVNFFHEAGWGIWPVMLFGSITLFFACYHAITPRKDFMTPIVGFGIATIIAGFLGSVVGIQNSVRYIENVELADKWIYYIGVRESLNNSVAALVIATLCALAATVGFHRLSKRAAAA